MQHCAELLEQRQRDVQLRRRQIAEPLDAVRVQIDGREYINFASNNYLGLTHHPKLLAAVQAATAAGAGAAGLISGYTPAHAAAERAIAQWKSTEAAVLLPSGYQANLAAIQTLAALGERYPQGVRFLLDKLVHASIIDAVRGTQAPLRVFPHNGMVKLRRLLEEAPPDQLQVVISESIFSMDGDACDLRMLAELRDEFGFILMLDEAHGSGVYGVGGAGFAAEMHLNHAVDVSIVTLSKALGSAGGAVCASRAFCDALLNFGRAYIYSTSVMPAAAACAVAAIEVMRDEPQRQARLREMALHVRSRIRCVGLEIPAGDSPIVAVNLQKETAALWAAERLKAEGLLVVAVRPPTVPPGSSRLRITLCSEHDEHAVARLVHAVHAVRAEFV
jgi:8-amino-7-oxononanoate synthase